ncbi:MAG: DUF4153 domain-containing protein [Myxococcales bacterium]|nr:DUF4153 domain-containing protein [Myxococcales bacterium]
MQPSPSLPPSLGSALLSLLGGARAGFAPPLAFLRGALRRLPVETVAVAVAAIAAISALHAASLSVWQPRLIAAALLTVPLAFAVRERAGRRATAAGAAVAALVTAGLIVALPDLEALRRPSFAWGYGLLALAALLVPFVAAAGRFATFVRRFFEELTTWSLLGAVALVALLVVGVALDQLLGLPTKRVTVDAMVLTAAAMTLVALDRLLPDRLATGKVPEIWRRLAVAIGAPFVAVMLGILVVYEVSVLARGELPRNLLSPLIIGAGFAGYGCTLIVSAIASETVGAGPLSPAEPHRFLRQRSVQLARAFPVLLLVLLPMALYAVLVRIDQYGLTPFRVVRLAALLCLAVVSALGAWRWLRHRAALTWHVPALVAAFAVAISVGPTSALQLSIRSQAARLDRLLTTVGASAPADRAVRTSRFGAKANLREVPLEAWRELESTVETLAELGGAAALGRVLSGELELCASRWHGHRCLDGLGLVTSARRDEPLRYYSASAEAPVPSPAGQLVFFTATAGTTHFVAGLHLHLQAAAGQGAGQGAGHGATELTVDLSALAALAAADKPLPPAPVPVRTASGADAGVVILQRLDAVDRHDGRELTRAEGVWIRRGP